MSTNANLSTANRWLNKASRLLNDAGIATARLDSLILLEDHAGKDRSWLLAHPDFALNDTSVLDMQLERRASHVPLAYIRGKSEFYGREFAVNQHTLEPRPETETLIEQALGILDRKYLILDIGTGSGAIAITMKLERPDATVIATDIDKKCIETAQKNAEKLGASVHFKQGNLLEPLSDIDNQIPDIALLANLPYVPDAYKLNKAAEHEPAHAIFGGKDGLDPYRELFHQISDINFQISYILTESLPTQHTELSEIARTAGYTLSKSADFIQVFSLIK